MTRTTIVLIAAAGLSAWVSAQSLPVGTTAAEQLHLFQANRPLLEEILDHGLKLSQADTHADRAEECRRTTRTISLALRWEAENAADPGRVAELSDHLTRMVRDGLAPTLADGLRAVPPQSPDFDRLTRVRDLAGREVWAVEELIPAEGPPQVRDARARLADAARLLDPK